MCAGCLGFVHHGAGTKERDTRRAERAEPTRPMDQDRVAVCRAIRSQLMHMPIEGDDYFVGINNNNVSKTGTLIDETKPVLTKMTKDEWADVVALNERLGFDVPHQMRIKDQLFYYDKRRGLRFTFWALFWRSSNIPPPHNDVEARTQLLPLAIAGKEVDATDGRIVYLYCSIQKHEFTKHTDKHTDESH